MTTPTYEELRAWAKRWQAIRKEAYAELVASYTPEQKALVRKMNEAASQAQLCKRRMMFKAGVHGDREDRVSWPQEPPL